MAKAVFITRYGVLYRPYFDQPMYLAGYDWVDGFGVALSRLTGAGYLLGVVENDRSDEKLTGHRVSDRMERMIRANTSGSIVFESCFHLGSDHCECRMPKTKMLEDIAARYGIGDFSEAVMIAGYVAAVRAAQALNFPKILYLEETGRQVKKEFRKEVTLLPDVTAAVDYLLAEEKA